MFHHSSLHPTWLKYLLLFVHILTSITVDAGSTDLQPRQDPFMMGPPPPPGGMFPPFHSPLSPLGMLSIPPTALMTGAFLPPMLMGPGPRLGPPPPPGLGIGGMGMGMGMGPPHSPMMPPMMPPPHGPSPFMGPAPGLSFQHPPSMAHGFADTSMFGRTFGMPPGMGRGGLVGAGVALKTGGEKCTVACNRECDPYTGCHSKCYNQCCTFDEIPTPLQHDIPQHPVRGPPTGVPPPPGSS